MTSSGVVGQGFGGHADLGHLVNDHAGYFVRCGLVQADIDLGVGLAQAGHGHRQHVAGLGGVVAMLGVPLSWALNCSPPMRLRLPTSRMMISMLYAHAGRAR